MVHFKYFCWIFLLLAVNVSARLVKEESKKFAVKSKAKGKLSSGMGENFKCDLELLPEQEELMYGRVRVRKADVSIETYKWSKNKEGLVIVPYRISQSAQYSADQLGTIRYAMDSIERETCIRFLPRKFASDFINISSGRFCKSNLGRIGGQQELSLNKNKCLKKGIVVHELLHALGYVHMHSRPNRDKYVKILWKNINPTFFREFDRVSPEFFNYYGTPYDYLSIMHYGAHAASKNGGLTIVPKDGSYVNVIGQRDGLSEGDIRRINNKYNCHVGKSSNIISGFVPKYSYHLDEPTKVPLFKKKAVKPLTKGDDDDDDLFNININI